MASNKKVIYLGLDYSDFDGGITEVNRKMGLLDQEFKLASEMAKRYGDETEQLNLKQEQLTQKINLQNIKLEEAKKKYDAVMKSQDNTNKAKDAADKALLKERIALEQLNNELQANKEKLDKIALSDADNKIAILEQEFKLAAEKAKSFSSETERLAMNSKMLTEKITQQAEKVEITKRAYDEAKKSGELSERQLNDLYSAYLQNETALEKLNNELETNNEKLDELETNTESFGDAIRNMASTLGVDINPTVEALASKFDGLDKNMGTAILTIGTVVTAFAGLTISAASTAQEMKTLSSVTGLSVESIQKFEYASTELNVSMDSLNDALKEITNKAMEAKNGSEELGEIFKKLGIRVTDTQGNLISAEETFYRTIDALGKITNETERDAIAMKLFGEEARRLNPLIEAGSGRLRELGIEAESLGLVMGEKSINSLAEFDSSMQQLNDTMDKVKMKLGMALLPLLQGFADLVGSIPTPVWVAILVFGALSMIILSVARAASTMAIANAALSATNVTVAATGAAATAGMGPLLIILLAIAAAIALIVGGAVGIKSAMNDVKDATSGIIDASNSSAQGLANVSTRSRMSSPNTYRPTRNNFIGTEDYEGGWTWINEGKPELVKLPRGTTIYNGADTERLMGGGDIYNININPKDIKEFNDVIQIVQRYKQTVRQGVVDNG